jgi:prepilin-type processing-associated H-X9-DG protein
MVYLGLIDPRASTAIFTKALPILIRQLNAEFALAQRRMGKAPRDVFLRLDPDTIPDAGELDRLLFPSLTTLTVDRQGAMLTHREAIPTLTSPATGAVLAALVAPAVQSSLEAARRVQCVNNLKQIALAMHNYHASNNAFPRPAYLDQKAKPLLSWRVAILPFIEQQELYDKFKQDEPWDSPHNKALLKEMPPIYRCPIRTNALPYTTNYRVFVGKGALFEKDQGIGVGDVTDGTSNTIMIVEATEAVPWTKPEDLSFDPAAAPALHGAGSPHPGGFNVSMADGSVRFLKNTIDLNVLRALITRAGGEVVGRGAF